MLIKEMRGQGRLNLKSLNLPRALKNRECTLKVAGGVHLDRECVGFVTADSI